MLAGMNEPTIEMLEQVLDAFNAHDLDARMRFFVDDCVLEMPRGPHPWGLRFEGRDRVREGLATRFAGIPDVHYGEDRHWVSGSRGCSEMAADRDDDAGRAYQRSRLRPVRAQRRLDLAEGLVLEDRRGIVPVGRLSPGRFRS